jgi:hypothetical protein
LTEETRERTRTRVPASEENMVLVEGVPAREPWLGKGHLIS